MTAHDYSDADDYVKLLNEPINVELDALAERVALATPRLTRAYLGASSAGDECLRKIQFEWLCSSFEGARQRLRFDRGHAAEATIRAQLVACGFAFAPPEALEFTALEYLKGHADGIIIAAPHLPGVHLMLPALWENKMIYAKRWRSLVKDGFGEGLSEIRDPDQFVSALFGKAESGAAHRDQCRFGRKLAHACALRP
jgi:hypothetical protein